MLKQQQLPNLQGQQQGQVHGHQLRGFKIVEEVQQTQGHNIDLLRVF